MQAPAIFSDYLDNIFTVRIIRYYQELAGKSLEIERVDLLTSVLRLHELAEVADDPAGSKKLLPFVTQWWEELEKLKGR